MSAPNPAIEAVARAIVHAHDEAEGYAPRSEDRITPTLHAWLPIARAAAEALLEPDERVVEAMAHALHEIDDRYNWDWAAYSHAPDYYEKRRNEAKAALAAQKRAILG